MKYYEKRMYGRGRNRIIIEKKIESTYFVISATGEFVKCEEPVSDYSLCTAYWSILAKIQEYAIYYL